MKRLLLILLGVCLPGLVVANGLFLFAPGSGGAGGSLCPQGTAFTDGCSAAVSGTPNDPTRLNIYGANRPPWNVAGIDYRVGNDGGALNDPSTTLPACATYAAGAQNTVSVNTAPCTLDHLDFSLHTGICIDVLSTGGTVTFTNNNFFPGATCQPAGGGMLHFAATATSNGVIKYNTFDQNYNTNFSNITDLAGAGDRDIEYNYFAHSSQHMLATQRTGNYTYKYNYAIGVGCCGAHGDWFALNNTTSTISVTEEFNTVIVDTVTTLGGGATAFCYMANFASSTLNNSHCQNDTYIARVRNDTSLGVSYPIRVEPAGTWGTISILNNYVDYTGAFAPIEDTTLGTTGAVVVCTGNKNLSTGATITTSDIVGGFITCS